MMIRIVGGPFDGSRLQAPKRSTIGLTVRLRSGNSSGRYLISERPGYPGQLDAVHQEA